MYAQCAHGEFVGHEHKFETLRTRFQPIPMFFGFLKRYLFAEKCCGKRPLRGHQVKDVRCVECEHEITKTVWTGFAYCECCGASGSVMERD